MIASREDLARRAVARAASVRDRFDVPMTSAVNVFDLCIESYKSKIVVRFQDISMEGVYLREPRPEIWLGLRPLVRRVYNAAHELGHHEFGHGSTFDELQADNEGEDEDYTPRPFKPNEYLANTFAAYLLMPRVAVTHAFTARGWKAEAATPVQCFTVACSLGVGYETLAKHLAYGLRLPPERVRRSLTDAKLPVIRRELLGAQAKPRLTVIDRHHTLKTVDTEVGAAVLMPAGTEMEHGRVATVEETPRGQLFHILKPGLVRAYSTDGKWAVSVRAMADKYVGLAWCRHLERKEGDDE
jgi:Zn-dependent peptidase ImmA (M78 family)